MRNFGKLVASPEKVTIPGLEIGQDDEGNPIFEPSRSVNVIFFRDQYGTDIVEAAKEYPHPFYIAIMDDGRIISMTNEIEQLQIAGHEIIGIDDNYGFTFGPGGTVYGKYWTGTAIEEPPVRVAISNEISRRQFFQQLAILGLISKDEAKTALQGGAIPTALQALVLQLPADEQFDAEMLIIGAATFARLDPLSDKIRILFGWSEAQRDDFWRAAAKL